MKVFPQNFQRFHWRPVSWQFSQLYLCLGLPPQAEWCPKFTVLNQVFQTLLFLDVFLGVWECYHVNKLKRPYLLSFFSFCRVSWKYLGNLGHLGVLSKLAYFSRLLWGLSNMIVIKCQPQCLLPCQCYYYRKLVTTMLILPPVNFLGLWVIDWDDKIWYIILIYLNPLR